MADYQIIISSVAGLVSPGSTTPTSIRVTGTAMGCETGSVLVKITCSAGSQHMKVPIGSGGSWTAVFPSISAIQCSRDKQIVVVAMCADHEECAANFTGILKYVPVPPPPQCDTVPSMTVNVDGCVGAGSNGATAMFTVTLTPPIAGCTYTWNFADGSPAITTNVPTVTHIYTTAGSFVATVNISCPAGPGQFCTSFARTPVTVPPCAGCPTVTGLTASVAGCAGPASTATVTFTGTLMPPISECSFLWAFGDATTELTTVPTTTHIYSAPATYAVAVTAICPGIPPCTTTTLPVTISRCCPIVTNITANVEDNECADGMGTSATVNFAAVTDPTSAPGNYTWNFGDGSPTVTNPGSNASHDYASSGTYTVQVTYTPDPNMFPGCSPSSFTIMTVSVPACPGGGNGGGGGGGGGGEGFGCFGLRVLMTVAAILAIVSLALAVCGPSAAYVLGWIALGLGITAALAGIFWAIFCPKPCAWALLLAWQVSVGVGFTLLYFTVCCPTFWWIGLALLAAGLALMFVWKRRCRKSTCAVLKELSIALSSVILPLLGWLGVIPALAACINHVVAAVLSTLAAAIAAAVLHCVP